MQIHVKARRKTAAVATAPPFFGFSLHFKFNFFFTFFVRCRTRESQIRNSEIQYDVQCLLRRMMLRLICILHVDFYAISTAVVSHAVNQLGTIHRQIEQKRT